MKKIFTISLFLISFLFIANLHSCSKIDDLEDGVTIGSENDGVYTGELSIQSVDNTQHVRRKVSVKKNKDKHVDLVIKDYPITLEENVNLPITEVLAEIEEYMGPVTLSADKPYTYETVEHTMKLSGSIANKVLKFKVVFTPIDITTGSETIIEFEGTLGADLNSSTAILSFGLQTDKYIANSSKIEAKQGKIVFCTTKNATDADLESVLPTIILAEGAKVSPALDQPQDFSKPVKYTITSEDGIFTKDYIINKLDRPELWDFEKWVVANPEATNEASHFRIPQTNFGFAWYSSDVAIAPYMHLEQITSTDPTVPLRPADQYGVTATTDSYQGSSAALIQTLKTRPSRVYDIPAVLGGNLYTGKYTANVANSALASTYGYPIYYKPLALKGFYKYKKGENYELCTNIEKPDETITIPEKEDAFRMLVVVYGVDNIEDESQMLTFTDIMGGSDRIIATAEWVGHEDKTTYTPFELPLHYVEGKDFSYTSNYRVALLFWSSAESYLYSGAPGSRLYLDNIELLTE